MTEPVVRVLVVDDQQLVRDGIASLLGIQPGIEVVGTAADGHEALERAAELDPDVVLMDVRMPGLDGVEATRALRRARPGCRVVMLTTFDDEQYVTLALRAGAASRRWTPPSRAGSPRRCPTTRRPSSPPGSWRSCASSRPAPRTGRSRHGCTSARAR